MWNKKSMSPKINSFSTVWDAFYLHSHRACSVMRNWYRPYFFAVPWNPWRHLWMVPRYVINGLFLCLTRENQGRFFIAHWLTFQIFCLCQNKCLVAMTLSTSDIYRSANIFSHYSKVWNAMFLILFTSNIHSTHTGAFFSGF